MPPVKMLEVPIDDLVKNPWNTNIVSPANETKLEASITRNGMFKPLLVREITKGKKTILEIIGGEHRWEAAKKLGIVTVPIVNFGAIDELRAKEIGVLDNARYGTDDTLQFADLLKEIGSLDTLQQFLPYGDEDLKSIFSAADIALDSLELSPSDEESLAPPEPPAAKAPKTHAIMRFKVSLRDAERITALIAKTQKAQGLTADDDLTNAGDALVHLLVDQFAVVTSPSDIELADLEELEHFLDEATS